ncbi:MAG: aldo/keto reductase [Candidatus Brocadiae bacterium]|nr:aldo/keto reductase [Candidatus Brocadiia bacterium]
MAPKRISRRRFLGDGALAVGAAGLAAREAMAAEPKMPPKSQILSFDERMEYRRCGKTDQWVSAISLGGHWKRIPYRGDDFQKNRTETVAQCLDSGINYIDACCRAEVLAYTKAVKALGRRKQMYMGFSHCGNEPRNRKFRTKKALLGTLDGLMKEAGLDYVDIWRPTCHEPGGMHTFNTSREIAAAGEAAVKQGKVRFFGISSHDRRWHEMMIREFPILSVVLFPYTARSKEKPKDSIFQTVRDKDIGVFGIKPFASNSIFKSRTSAPDDTHRAADDKSARMALRYILCNDAITAPIPGLIFPHHVDNCLKAIEERRKEDIAVRPAILDDAEFAQMADGMFNDLPPDYQWLKNWEWV